ncbi:MAG: aminomethyltransferase family protein, partial [Pseudomonadota bacterium]
NTIPRRVGRLSLCHLLTSRGGVRAEFTVYREAKDTFYLVSAGTYERHDHDTLKKLLPAAGVTFQPITEAMGVLVLAGPKSRDVLQQVTRTDLSDGAFPWLSGRPISIGRASALAMRVNFVGELGWELHHPIAMQNEIFDALMTAGADHGIGPFGIRAMDAMRIEKSYRLIPRELSIEYSAYESALDRFIKPNKGDFIGREGLAAWEAKGRDWQFVTLAVDGITDADPRGNEPIIHKGDLVGRATSGGYGWRVGHAIALAMVRPELASVGQDLEITILGENKPARVISESPFDADNVRLRG